MMLWLLMLTACGLIRGGGGTAVGNPGKALVRLATSNAGGWSAATADEAKLVLADCDGLEERVDLGPLDLIEGPSFEIPVGTWCDLTLWLGGLRAVGKEPLDVTEATATLGLSAVRFDRARWILELGEPGAPEAFADRSGIFKELVPDGQLDPLERAQGPAGAGNARTLHDTEPPVLLAVGPEGLRAALTGPDSPTYAQFDERHPLFSAAYLDGRWVAVGGDATGFVGISDDQGATWSLEEVSLPLSAVAAFGEGFVGASFSSQLWSSPDGLEWTVRSTGNSVWRSFAASPDRIVIVGGGTVGYSDDGVSWTVEEPPGAPDFQAAAWGPPGFVAVGEGGERWFSPDGASWAVQDEGGDKLFHAAWSGAAFVVGGDGNRWRSADGKAWEALPAKVLEGVTFHDGRLFGATGGIVFESTDDGETWLPWVTLQDGSPWALASNQPFEP